MKNKARIGKETGKIKPTLTEEKNLKNDKLQLR